MRLLRIGGLIISAILLGLGIAILIPALEPHPTKPEPSSSILHAKEGPCPAGYRKVPKVFSERDGTSQDGYVKESLDPLGGEFSIDYLLPGESLNFLIPLKLPEVKPEAPHA